MSIHPHIMRVAIVLLALVLMGGGAANLNDKNVAADPFWSWVERVGTSSTHKMSWQLSGAGLRTF